MAALLAQAGTRTLTHYKFITNPLAGLAIPGMDRPQLTWQHTVAHISLAGVPSLLRQGSHHFEGMVAPVSMPG